MARASVPDSFTAGPGRTPPSVTQSTRVTAENVAAADKKRLQKRASSKRIRKASREGAQQTAEGQGGNGLIKASYPATPESGGRVGGQGAAAGAAAAVAAPSKIASRRALALLYQRGAILSDSDSDSEEPPAARADKSELLSADHVDSAAPVAAPAALPAAAAAPVLPPAPKPAVVLVAPPSRGKAAAVRQAVAGAAQAAGRAMAAAQAAGPASRQQGMQVVLPAEGRASSPIVLTPPKRAAFTAAAVDGPRAAAQVPQGQAAAAPQWEPAFPGPGGEEPAQQQQQQGGSWAEGGWSNVAL